MMIPDSKEFIQVSEAGFISESVAKPWGSYRVLGELPGFKVKCLVVKPGASLSLQSHTQRSEHWIVFKGKAQVINGEKEYLLQTNETTFIPTNTKHRLSNPETSDLIVIEVQMGAYLEENDIIRYEDLYARV